VEEEIMSNTCPHCGSHNVEYITRVTGFFSKVGSWNKGKIAELRDRRQAIEWNKRSLLGIAGEAKSTQAERRIKLFTKQNCPRCPAAKELAKKLEARGIKVEYYDVESVEGMAEAGMHGVLSTPTIVVVNGEDEEIKSWRGTVPSEQEIAQAVMGAS